MKPQLSYVGNSRTPVVIVDGISQGHPDPAEVAAAIAPFPVAVNTYYPGLRRFIHESDADAFAYVHGMLQAIAPIIGGGFNADGFDLVEASFSMVTKQPSDLMAAQRIPHFDSTNPRYLAVLHYLSDTPGTGTAFYRQRSTGIETVTDANMRQFIETAKRDGEKAEGYINSSNDDFEQIGAVEAVRDRLIIYPGCLLHSGIIPPDMALSSDPREGRLTTNIFVMAR